ncbi:MAG: beta-N-acetylhexosaminidase [Bacteroidales bacterium]|nr:beta-N-acetylhexosaminidase [Bacteroidales bacterium]
MNFRNLILTLLPALALTACHAPQAPEIHVIPQPQQITATGGVFKVAGAPVSYEGVDARTAAQIQNFATRLTTVTGKASLVSETLQDKGFSFRTDASLTPEAYTIDIKPAAVQVAASDFNGFFYALQTLGQMLPPAFYGDAKAKADWVLPCAQVNDAPRFGYRGMHMDPSRHFWSVDEVKKYLDVMALYKLNRLHWHLTDDQGWRVEIKKYPKLTEVGSQRKETIVKKNFNPYVGDGQPYGGFYTQDEIREVVAYAADRGITVIPEIDLPGHMLAALAAYPELGCTGGPYDVWTIWGVSEDVLCVGQEKTFEFLEGVLTEIMDLFPSEYIHIGGDESPKVRWENCPRCQARIRALGLRDGNGHTKEQLLQNYVTARMQEFLGKHGRKIIGWDEILEGELAPGATVMSWRGADGGIQAASRGFDVIMTPNSHFYFDYYQSQERDREPFGIGGYVSLEKVYSFDPYDKLSEEAKPHILGAQANLWTEYIATPEHLEYMLLPRMCALSEVQWCQERDYDRFLASLPHTGEILDALGYTWCKYALGTAGMPGDEHPVRTPEEMEQYRSENKWDW